METKRQRIVNEIVTRLRTIGVEVVLESGDEFQTDVGETVEDWRARWNAEELPAISVCDLVAETNKEFRDATQTLWTLTVSIRIFTAADGLAEDLRKMIGDVNTAIKQDPRWTVDGVGLAVDTWPRFERVIVPTGNPDKDEAAGAEVVIEIEFKTGTFNAYR